MAVLMVRYSGTAPQAVQCSSLFFVMPATVGPYRNPEGGTMTTDNPWVDVLYGSRRCTG